MNETQEEIAEKLLTQLLYSISSNKPFMLIDKNNNKWILFPQNIIAIQLYRTKSETNIEIDYTTKYITIAINIDGEITTKIKPDCLNY